MTLKILGGKIVKPLKPIDHTQEPFILPPETPKRLEIICNVIKRALQEERTQINSEERTVLRTASNLERFQALLLFAANEAGAIPDVEMRNEAQTSGHVALDEYIFKSACANELKNKGFNWHRIVDLVNEMYEKHQKEYHQS